MKRLFLLAVLAVSSVFSFAQEPVDTVNQHQLNEITVTSRSASQRIKSIQLGADKLEIGKLNNAPQLFGEPDIIKSITLLPGVHSEGDGGGGFEVRGGNSSQNLILLDGISLYNPSHVMGIFSTFNSDAIGRATLFKGPIPASYGEAVSSILDVGLSPGNMEDYTGSATIGLLAAKLNISGPILREKLSFNVSARRSYLDAFLKLSDEYKSTVLNFYDITAKLRYTPGYNDIIDVSVICARDNMAIKNLMGMRWGNYAGAISWIHHRGENLRFATTVSYTDYEPTMWMSVINVNQTLREFIRNANFTEKVDYELSDRHRLQFGLRSEFLQVKSGEFETNKSNEKEVRNGLLNALWINYEGDITEKWSLNSGIRFSFFDALARHTFSSRFENLPYFANKLHCDTEFRINIKYNISPLHNLKFGIGDVTQNLHAIRSSNVSFPFDRYALTSASVKPERSFQLSIGYAGMTERGGYDWSTEIYHRQSKNVYDYKDGMNMFSSVDLESLILGGKGRSYGVEFMVRKNTGRLMGWVSYTFSKTETQIPGINSGRWYDASNDRRHDFNITALYNINKRWNLSASWVFSSGTPLTAPDAKYQLDGTTCYYYSQRNGYQTPDTHHLDVSANYKKVGEKLTQEVSFGIYNLYNHYNPYLIYFEDDQTKPSGTRAVQQSLYGIIPSVSYTLKF